MKLPTVLRTWLRRSLPAPPRRRSARLLEQAIDLTEVLADDVTDTRPPGCGWFDSSHDLQRGLLVTEHASADTVAAELPLDGWIGLHLAGWQPSSRRLG